MLIMNEKNNSMNLTHNMCLEITLLKLLHLPEANELMRPNWTIYIFLFFSNSSVYL